MMYPSYGFTIPAHYPPTQEKTGKETNGFISFFAGHPGWHSMEKPRFKIPDLLLPYLYIALITLQTMGTVINGDIIREEDSFVARGVGA